MTVHTFNREKKHANRLSDTPSDTSTIREISSRIIDISSHILNIHGVNLVEPLKYNRYLLYTATTIDINVGHRV